MSNRFSGEVARISGKLRGRLTCGLCGGAIVALLVGSSTLRAATIYDNSFNDLLLRFTPGTFEVGDELRNGVHEQLLGQKVA